MLSDEIRDNIDKCKIISFDIFDTLLLRPYIKPNDLFKHLGFLNQIENLEKMRIWAFEDARKKYCTGNIEEVTLDQIYEFIPKKYQFIKEKEIELEKQILQPNYEIKKVWDYAKKLGKKIIVISDMYLSKNVLADILLDKGYKPDEIYVSSEYKKLKARGSLYDYVIKDLGISSEKILHIGDNYLSDIKKAQEYGIRTIYYSKVIDRYFKKDSRALKFYNTHKNDLYISIIFASSAIILHNKQFTNPGCNLDTSYWYNLGIKYAGPIAYTFISWLNNELKRENIKEVLFTARDCYCLQKVLEIINPHIKSHYIYAPRLLSLAATLDIDLKISHSEFEGVSGINALKSYFKEKYPNIANWDDNKYTKNKDAYSFFQSNYNVLKELSNIELERYTKYLLSLNLKNKQIAFVDMMTTFFTSHNLVKKALPDFNIKGFYSYVSTVYKSYFVNKFDFKYMFSNKYNIPFVELLITSPEKPIVDVISGGGGII